MSIKIDRTAKDYGYGQVEPVKVAWGETNEIYAQLPAAKPIETVENGMFGKYDRSGRGAISTNMALPQRWLMVFGEERLFERNAVGHYETKKDFHYSNDQFFDGKIYPRMVGTTLDDTIITNCLKDDEYSVEDLVSPMLHNPVETLALLEKITKEEMATRTEVWVVVKETKLADGHDAVMIQKIK